MRRPRPAVIVRASLDVVIDMCSTFLFLTVMGADDVSDVVYCDVRFASNKRK